MKVSKVRYWRQYLKINDDDWIKDLSTPMLLMLIKKHSKIVTIRKLKGENVKPEYQDDNVSSLMLKVEIEELNKRTKRKRL